MGYLFTGARPAHRVALWDGADCDIACFTPMGAASVASRWEVKSVKTQREDRISKANFDRRYRVPTEHFADVAVCDDFTAHRPPPRRHDSPQMYPVVSGYRPAAVVQLTAAAGRADHPELPWTTNVTAPEQLSKHPFWAWPPRHDSVHNPVRSSRS